MARRQARSYRSRSRSTRSARGSYSRRGAVRRSSRGRSAGRGRSGGTVRVVIQTQQTPAGMSSVGIPGTVGLAAAPPPRKAQF